MSGWSRAGWPRSRPNHWLSRSSTACFADPGAVSAQRLAEAVDEVRRRYEAPWYVSAYLRTLRGIVTSFVRAYLPGGNSLWRLAGRITAPTLVIAGRQDRLVDTRVAPIVARVVPDSRLIMLDGVGHVAQMEQPRMVARAIRALLDEVRGRAAPAVEIDATRAVVDAPLSSSPLAADPFGA